MPLFSNAWQKYETHRIVRDQIGHEKCKESRKLDICLRKFCILFGD